MNAVLKLEGKQFKREVDNREILESTLHTNMILDNILDEHTDTKADVKQILDIVQEYRNRVPGYNGFKKTYANSKDNVNATVQMLFKKLNSKISDIEEEFEDVHDRIYNFGVVLKILAEIIDNLDESNHNEKYIMRISIIIHDIIKKVKSENLDYQQLQIIKQGLLIVVSGKASKEEFQELDNLLLDCGLDWIYGG